jgi:hypothetical protein
VTDDASWMVTDNPMSDEALREHLLYWSKKTVAERLAEAHVLNRRMLAMRGIDLDAPQRDWTARRVPREPPATARERMAERRKHLADARALEMLSEL